jgi:hypothetical protein
MSVFLYCAGAIAFAAGAILAGFGIPVSEFSFGNTLIIAGAVAMTGGLIVVGLGAVVAELQRQAETLPARNPVRSGRPLDMFDAAISGRTVTPPFAPKAGPAAFEPPAEAVAKPALPEPAPPSEEPGPMAAPTLHNPDAPPFKTDAAAYAPPPAAEAFEPPPVAEPPRAEPQAGSFWRRSPPPAKATYFDAMWPSESRGPSGRDEKPDEPLPSPPADEPAPVRPEPPLAEPAPAAAAILKSGVVDGMGYTLYVDGSIEAELPQGTLRFASITELRSHLEKNAG